MTMLLVSALIVGPRTQSGTNLAALDRQPVTGPSRVQDGSPPKPAQLPVKVRHLAAKVNGWSVSETANFRLYHREWPELAERAGRVAERARDASYRKWFGKPDPEWRSRCDLYLHTTGAEYQEATGVPAEVPGHTSIDRDKGRVLSRRIDIHCDRDDAFLAVVPHEVTHAVMADKLGDKPPLWASEAMAILAEPRGVIDAHLRNLPGFRDEGRLFPVAQLVRMKAYPEPRYVRAYYAQSLSLVELLVEEKGPEVLIAWLRDGAKDGPEKALQQHYGCSMDEMDKRWRGYAFDAKKPQPLAGTSKPATGR